MSVSLSLSPPLLVIPCRSAVVALHSTASSTCLFTYSLSSSSVAPSCSSSVSPALVLWIIHSISSSLCLFSLHFASHLHPLCLHYFLFFPFTSSLSPCKETEPLRAYGRGRGSDFISEWFSLLENMLKTQNLTKNYCLISSQNV